MRLKWVTVAGAAIVFFFSNPAIAQEIEFHQDSPTEFSFSIKPKFRLYNFDVDHPAYILGPEKATLTIKALTPQGVFDPEAEGATSVLIDGNLRKLEFNKGLASLEIFVDDNEPISIASTDTDASRQISVKMISRFYLVAALGALVAVVATLTLKKDRHKKYNSQTIKASV